MSRSHARKKRDRQNSIHNRSNITMVTLTPEQLHIQALFKEFLTRLNQDAAKFTQGPTQITVDLKLGVAGLSQKDKAIEYGPIMNEIIGIVAKEQRDKETLQGPTGILAQ